uniref:Vacuolar protein sorting-associated protein 11 homolog n=1 Tax=Syphacia muris TaxID=451379 RepID=A0A0N5AAS4_9BILA
MSLVELGWRQFTFFEKHDVQDPSNPDERFVGLKNLNACCSAYGDGFSLFGERCGNIFQLSRKLEEYFWVAHKCKLYDLALAENVLATVGEDEDGINTLVKLWQLNRIEKDSPFCLRIIRTSQLSNANNAHCVAACSVAIHSSLKHLAIGFKDSSLFYCSGDLLKDSRSNKWIAVVSGKNGGEELTGTALAWLPGQKKCVLFAMSASSVKSYVVHDAKGCGRDLWCFNEEINLLTVATTEMVHFYDAEQSLTPEIDGGKGRCHALGRGAEKVQLVVFKEHIALLTKQVRQLSTTTDFPTQDINWVISIYDVDGQCVAFSCAWPMVTRIFLLDSVLMVLTQDGNLAAVKEKHITKKLETLFKKNLYDLAVGLARRSMVGSDYLVEIHQKYGDYLYKSGDFENAVQQYKETIGYLEPSYVIKKFLDGSHIKELSSYLESLYHKNYATTKHNTMLLNCYIKMGSKDDIDKFIEKGVECDVESAVHTLRSASYLMEACRLCEQNELHDQLFTILIEELKDYDEALNYAKKCDLKVIGKYLEKYGKVSLEKNPEVTIDCLIKVVAADDDISGKIDVAQLMKMFIGNPKLCSHFIDAVVKLDTKNTKLRTIMLELRLRQWMHHDQDFLIKDNEIMDLIDDNNLEEAMQLCLMFDFAPGIIFAYSKLEKFDELLDYHMRQNNLREVIDLCKRKKSQKLWVDALVFTSRAEKIDQQALEYMLQSIEEANCVHPLLVLEILSHSDILRVAHVKNYIMNWLRKHDEQALVDERKIIESEKKMKELESQIESLNYNVQVFQQSKCSACDTALQVPAVHFLCNHSYHLHCLESYSEKADRCPSCMRFQNDQQYASSDSKSFESDKSYLEFQEQVNKSSDCMSLLASYISRGLFQDIPKDNSVVLAKGDLKKTQFRNNFANKKDKEERKNGTPKNPSDEASSNPFDETFSYPFDEASSDQFNEFNGKNFFKTKSTNPFGDDF